MFGLTSSRLKSAQFLVLVKPSLGNVPRRPAKYHKLYAVIRSMLTFHLQPTFEVSSYQYLLVIMETCAVNMPWLAPTLKSDIISLMATVQGFSRKPRVPTFMWMLSDLVAVLLIPHPPSHIRCSSIRFLSTWIQAPRVSPLQHCTSCKINAIHFICPGNWPFAVEPMLASLSS